MCLADLWNNELIIVRKQWHLHHQSTLSGQFLLPAAAFSHCSQQWRIMTREHNNRGLFSSLFCFVLHRFCVRVSLADALSWFLSQPSFWLLISIPFTRSHNTLSHTQAWTGRGVLNYSNSWQRVSPSMNTTYEPAFYTCLFFNFMGANTEATAQIISCPFSVCKRKFEMPRTRLSVCWDKGCEVVRSCQ